MTIEFDRVGLKAGLEVHQQLDTGKLFCRCPSVLREDKPDIVFRRRLRPVASELGEFDKAALDAFEKGLLFEYQAYTDSTCLVEADDEPPMPCNAEALDTALKIALMCNSHILDELTVMRKTVVDGSNVSGFQRTLLVAVGGAIELKGKRVGIQTIVLEEDAARPMEKTAEKIVYRLDRLGIPLIELATEPELSSPGEVKECALKIGELFRRTCKAKRGLGSIRQDLNVSVEGGARIEIKGVQALELIDEYVRREVQRQLALLELKEELEKRGVNKEMLSIKPKDVSSVFKQSKCRFLCNKSVFGAKVRGFVGLLGKELQPKRRFGTEIAEYVRAKSAAQGILHSDELPSYGVTSSEVSAVRKALGCTQNDAFVLVQLSPQKAEKAFSAIRERLCLALIGVPEETRNALEDGNTSYTRPLPGAARMYPETDLEPIRVEAQRLKRVKGELPLSVGERQRLYRAKGLSERLVQKMVLSNKACFFEELLAKGFDAKTAATLLLETSVQLKRQGFLVSTEMIKALLAAEKKGTLTKDVFADVLRRWSTSPKKSLEEIVREFSLERASETEVRRIVEAIVKRNALLVKERGLGSLSALMGEAMKQLRGRVAGSEVSRILKEAIEKRAKKE